MGRQQLKVEFLDKLGEDLDIVNAAKVSYGREATVLDDKALGTMTHMADHEHGSPFEMVVMKVRVTCPLFAAVQWIRHRIGSINMESSRYMDREQVEVYLPDTEDIKGQDPNNKQASSVVLPLENALAVLESMKNSEEVMRRNYHDINKVRHASKEIARFVTTQNIIVQFIYMTNLRAWANFCLLRNDLHAQFEIRYLAREVERLLKEHFPNATRLLIKEMRKRKHIVFSMIDDITNVNCQYNCAGRK